MAGDQSRIPQSRIENPQLASWRAAGSLRYLAHCLGKTGKQVARYWDQGLIPGAYQPRRRGPGRTGSAGAHRRVRYTDQTVAIVAQRVGIAREAALRRRYPARSRHPGGVLWESKLAREAILGYQRLNLEDVSLEQRILDLLPIEELIATCSPREFRARALAAYREIRRHLERSGPDASLVDRILVPLLSQPTLGEFVTAYEEAVDQLTWRDVERGSNLGKAAAELAVSKPIAAMFTVAAVAIAKSGRRPSVASMARELSISRRGLYRLCERLRCREDLKRAIAFGRKDFRVSIA
jgi:hypothetical protein